MPDVRFLCGDNCDTDHYLEVTKLRERLPGSKQRNSNFNMQRFYLRKMNNTGINKQCKVEFSSRFANLENLDDNVDISRARENIRGNIRIPAKLKQQV
jgi:hypothetical protein